MTTITVRDVPEATRAALAEAARERGQSLQAYTLGVLQQDAGFRRNRQVLREIARSWSSEDSTGPTTSDIVEIIARERADRDAELLRRVQHRSAGTGP